MPKYTEEFIRNLMKKSILVLDGATGTMLQRENLTEEDFGGAEYYGCNEILVETRPDIILKVHRIYLESGADIIETNSFGSTPLVLDEYGLGHKAYELSRKAAELARQAADEFDTPEEPRFVAGSMGPTTKSVSLTGGVTFEELIENFLIQARGLQDGGVDIFLLETAQDTLNLKAALIALLKLREESGVNIPYMVSGTIEPMGTMLAGQGVESLVASLEHFKPLSVGMNCGTGPDFMKDHVRRLHQTADSFISVYPNAGMPDEDGKYNETPKSLADQLGEFCDNGWLNIVGGCCGTTPDHIKAIKQMARTKKPRSEQSHHVTRVSGIDYLELDDSKRPYLVGERSNSLGSKKFRDLIESGNLEEATDIARAQVKSGAHIIDVCLQNPDRDELSDMKAFLPLLMKKIKAPVMIDSTSTPVLEYALTQSQGKLLYNSVNLENGEDRFAEVAPLYHQFGFALVVGTIDNDPQHGMGVTRKRKLEIAEKSYDLLVNKYKIDPRDIIFDPLVFPVGTGDADYIGSAQETIEGVRLIKERFPECRTILGVSNVSFGLPAAGREILNSVFIHYNVQAGLDLAIVNAEKYLEYEDIPENERKLAEELLFHTKESYDSALASFASFYKNKKSSVAKGSSDKSHLSPEERLSMNVLEGSVSGLTDDLNEVLKTKKPIEIINGPLMAGMAEVGRLFNANQLIVAEVLQSAEVMKAAVRHLEKFMEKSETSVRAKFLLATVKGDVHDIGKNLVEIILSNNGYEVINLGIKVPAEDIEKACLEHKPYAIGLSGLLVKSAEQMVLTAEYLSSRGIHVPILVGGAALSEKFVRKKIQPVYEGSVIYSKDAMNGLDIMNRITDDRYREEMLRNWSRLWTQEEDTEAGKGTGENDSEGSDRTEAGIGREKMIITYDWGPGGKPVLPPENAADAFRGVRLSDQSLFAEVFKYVNPGMLYKKHLGFRGNTKEAEKNQDPKFMELKALMDSLQSEVLQNRTLKLDGYYKLFKAASDGDDLILFSESGRELTRFHFQRQKKGWELCLSDFAAPLGFGGNTGQPADTIGLFVVTTGIGARETAADLKDKGSYLRSHALSALALESAEGFAEVVHRRMRSEMGVPDERAFSAQELFSMKYQGARFSFGYPACPDLADQEKLFAALDLPSDFGVKLTEGFSMDPEASVSALVFTHPQARYFSVE